MTTYFINITLVSSFLLLPAYFTMASGSAGNLVSNKFGALNEVTYGTNSFAFSLYRALSKQNPNSNVFTSPLSLQMVMALAYSGAGGKTAEEIATVLKMPKDIASMFNGYNALINLLKNPVLNIATKMFLEKTFMVKEDFSKNVGKYFESDAEQLNFKSDSDGAKNVINDWVEKKTNNKIKDLISDGDLNPYTVMVLVNAIHFKANWKTPFPVSSTHPEKFYINDKDTIEVQMMFKSDDFGYAESEALDAKILELPYEGDEFSMYILLPNQITGLAALEDAISKVNLVDVLKEVYTTKVDVSLPKFEITQTIDLNDILKSLGVTTMFDESQADFSGISDEQICVSKVIQKAFIQVDEKGTEAAAATGMLFTLYCYIEPSVFKASHPFLFIIARQLSNMFTILFTGKFMRN